MSRYKKRGVSSQKEDVHQALKHSEDLGIFPTAFCKIMEDDLCGDKNYCNIMHADGAGTKSSLAYLYYRETGDLTIFEDLVMDTLVMNIDDLLCVGAMNNFLISNTIGRNSTYIPAEVIKAIILGYEKQVNWFRQMGFNCVLTGGETADVGDLVRTIILDSTITVRLKKSAVIANDMIKSGQLIIGLSSSGQATYEKKYNSGIGSNGLTSARHDLFNAVYKTKYPESCSPDLPSDLTYSGPYQIMDKNNLLPVTVGQAALSPTRTYAPVIREILINLKDKIGGMVHCTGGGQTKCLNFGKGVHYIKNNLFPVPPIFNLIQTVSQTPFKEMYQVFNMGHLMEIYADKKTANEIISIAGSFGIEAQVIGEITASNTNQNRLTLLTPEGEINYEK